MAPKQPSKSRRASGSGEIATVKKTVGIKLRAKAQSGKMESPPATLHGEFSYPDILSEYEAISASAVERLTSGHSIPRSGVFIDYGKAIADPTIHRLNMGIDVFGAEGGVINNDYTRAALGSSIVEPLQPPSLPEEARLALLDHAAGDAKELAHTVDGLGGSFDSLIFSRTLEILGGSDVLGSVRSEFDLIAQLQHGFPVAVVENLRQTGLDAQILEEAIAPKRTLARRKAEGQRLTTTESEATWRLAHLIAFAEKVFAGLQAALSWLARPKLALGGRKPTELLSTALGTARVEFLLRELEWGNT